MIISKDNLDAENILIETLEKIRTSGPNDYDEMETLSHIKLNHNEIFIKYESHLLFLLGLFYKTSEPRNIVDLYLNELSLVIKAETNMTLSILQADIYNKIKESLVFSFSAPASVGKSHLLKELIYLGERDVVIVVPSRALIAEYIIDIKSRVDNNVLVLPFIDIINAKNTTRKIYVITPERGIELFKYKGKLDIEIFFFDEAQISEDTIRGMIFDSFVRRVKTEFPDAKKIFAHPYVDNPNAQLLKHSFVTHSTATRYNQNTVGKIFVSWNEIDFEYFSPNNKKIIEKIDFDMFDQLFESGKTLLIYASKNQINDSTRVYPFIKKYIKHFPSIQDKRALELIQQMKDYIGADDKNKKSQMISYMKRGIVMHHGSMPLRMRFIIEEFIRFNYAKICLATSTLQQGINMPFDAIFIDNFNRLQTLYLKNLIGRAGRSTKQPYFDYGYIIVKKKNMNTFINRMNQQFEIQATSRLDTQEDFTDIDLQDIVEASRNNTFDDKLEITKTQVDRLKDSNLDTRIESLLDNIADNGEINLTSMNSVIRDELKTCLKDIFISHLKRKVLTKYENSILRIALTIYLWKIQKKSFKEIIAIRYNYFLNNFKDNAPIFSQSPHNLPNKNARYQNAFEKQSIEKFNYDTLIYDTYDYLDKVIGFSLKDPISAYFYIFYEKYKDKRALIMYKLLKYGTSDEDEILMLRYGFEFEDFDWLKPVISKISEDNIEFNDKTSDLSEQQLAIINKYAF